MGEEVDPDVSLDGPEEATEGRQCSFRCILYKKIRNSKEYLREQSVWWSENNHEKALEEKSTGEYIQGVS